MRGCGLLVDTHAHLGAADFDRDREAVIGNAANARVTRILTVGIDLASSLRAIEVADEFASVEAAVGVHPSRADDFESESGRIQELLSRPQVRAVGEIGLDYVRGTASRETQRSVFRTQLQWASQHRLPVVVHDREAHADVLADLKAAGSTGVLHCFSGSLDMAKEACRLGLYISFAGNLTYKKSVDLQRVATEVPSENLLVETDSPYLSPQEWRGRRNEPAHLAATAKRLAELRRWSPEAVADVTTANAAALFGWN